VPREQPGETRGQDAQAAGSTPPWPGQREDREARLLDSLVRILAAMDGPADEAGIWPERLWAAIVEHGANRWVIPEELGGAACDRPTLVCRYGLLAEGSLTAAFLLTQHDAAARRMVPAATTSGVSDWLRRIAAGEAFTTVGLSQLTTSRRRGPAALQALPERDGRHRLSGVIPWVSGACRANVLVTGATVPPDGQALFLLPMDREGVRIEPSFALAALQASCTAEVICNGALVEADEVLAGPMPDVMSAPGMAGTGGLETSALALGQARAAIAAMEKLAGGAAPALEAVDAFGREWNAVVADLMAAAAGESDAPAPGEIRRRSNGLVIRATQAYLTARKGTGFLRAEPAQRWARQALFFLVWSCPGPVAQGILRDLAGICGAE
jgi:alkylation response protein AidB-like acyl-CoA dehydrogenase